MIDTIKNEELKNRQEELLKNMRMLRHTVADMLGSKSFLKDIDPGAQNGVITVYGEQFPIYITSSTLAADGLPDITDDIYDEDNYLSLISDDDLLWYALVEHLAHQADLLLADNNKYSDELVDANEEMDKLKCELADEIKARQGYEESLKQLRDELNAANNEINELEEDHRETNKKCSEYVKEIDKLAVDNKRLSERIKTLVIEKTNRPETAEKVSDPKDKYLDMDELQLLTKITELENENEELTEELGRIKRNNEYLKKEKQEAELLAYRLTRGEMRVQFDSMKSLEHENGVLKNENIDLAQKLCQKVMHATYSAHVEEPEEENMQKTITKETLAELTEKINELETKLKDKDERINQLSKNNSALSVEINNIRDLLKNADRDAKFYAREVDHLRQENDKIYSILNDAVKVVQNRNKQK